MEEVIEFDTNEIEFKKYLEECLKEEKIDYVIKIEDRWTQQYKQNSKYYQVYCLYVDNNYLDKVNKFIKKFKNAIVVTEGIEEFKNIENEEENNKFKIFTKKIFFKIYWCTIIVIGILIIIGIKLSR